jgi:hypothetical protein
MLTFTELLDKFIQLHDNNRFDKQNPITGFRDEIIEAYKCGLSDPDNFDQIELQEITESETYTVYDFEGNIDDILKWVQSMKDDGWNKIYYEGEGDYEISRTRLETEGEAISRIKKEIMLIFRDITENKREKEERAQQIENEIARLNKELNSLN